MKDLDNFIKLFSIKIPSQDYFDYYFELLCQSPKYSYLLESKKIYEQAEQEIDNLYSYKQDKADEIINYIKNSELYELFNQYETKTYPTNRSFTFEADKNYLSIDIRKANWQAFKWIEKLNQVTFLPEDYEQLLDQFDCHLILKISKSFRQFIFGHLNSKRQGRIQREIMELLLNTLKENGFQFYIEAVFSDELFISNFSKELIPFMRQKQPEFRLKELLEKRIDSVKIHNITEYDNKVEYQELYEVPGNQFFVQFKKYILQLPLELKDCIFTQEKQKVIWWEEAKEVIMRNNPGINLEF